MATRSELEQIFSSYAAEWNLSEADIKSAVEMAVKDNVTHELSSNKTILFIYAKKLFPLYPTREAVDRLCNSPEYAKMYAKLKAIVMTGESKAAVGTHASLFDRFVEEHPEWKKENGAFVVFRDHPQLKGKHSHVERYQKSGLCSMHASIAMQHYLVSMDTTSSAPMLNMAEFWRKHASTDELLNHFINDQGRDSFAFFKRISSEPLDFNDAIHNPQKKWKYLQKYGPALVSNFQVTEGFLSSRWAHLNGEPAETQSIGRHAMVLVGYRKVGLNKHRYLLQNWWKEKPYIEVDSSYLELAGASIYFITKKQSGLGQFEYSPIPFVECEDLDSPEKITVFERSI